MMQSLYIHHHESLITSNTPKNYNKFRDPAVWYTGETGILPIDEEIKKAQKYGYSHHIVRLMILLNFFILCELHPYEIYKWFMEVVSIDAYSWVMESNIYAMGYFNPKVMTKPYLSTSNYVLKMTNYKRDGHWDKLWDALYHDFVSTKPKEYTFFYKRTLKDTPQPELLKMARDFKANNFVRY
jgi:deoxyribodipyrimidine photolyase-related protein